MAQRSDSPKHLHVLQAKNHMATTFELVISCEASRVAVAENVLASAHELIAQLEDELTEFRPTSPIYRLNHSPAFVQVRMPESVLELLEAAERIQDRSSGYFSVTAKGKGPVFWDRSIRCAWRSSEEAHISFGAIGKGYALDRVRKILEREGFNDFMLVAGGSSIVLSGFAAPGEPWSWGWSWGRTDSAGAALGIPLRHESGLPLAIGVSGTHEKGDHIIDPRTGAPVPPALAPRSALVAHPSATEADALSTAFFAAGPEAWRKFERLGHSMLQPPALASIEPDETPRWNGTFQKLWGALSAFALCFISQLAAADEEAAIDLGAMGLNDFTPYVTERNPWWMILPALSIALVLLHLKKPPRRNSKMATSQNSNSPAGVTPFATKRIPSWALAAIGLYASIERATAVEFEPLGKAVAGLLGTTKAFMKKATVSGTEVQAYYSKNSSGKAERLVFIEKGIYEPDCTHTWAIGVSPATQKVTGIRVIEMSCPHAFPTRASSFLDQYKGKGPADLAKLHEMVKTIAKATGSSKLTNDAVTRSVKSAVALKGQF